MNTELTTSLVTQIKQAHNACCAADHPIREALIEKANRARECGIYLIEAKAQCGHGRWMEWVNLNLGLSMEMVSRYIRFANCYPNPITALPECVDSLKDAMIASGALVAPARTEQQRSQLGFLTRFTDAAMRFTGLLTGQIEKQSLDDWPDSEVEGAIAEIEKVEAIKPKLLARLGR